MPKLRDRWDPPDLSDSVCLVTGASFGVGRGIARVLGECGASVYVSARRERPLRRTAREVTMAGGRGIDAPCDHRSDAQVESLFARIAGEAGRLDVIVNNVVGWGDGPQPWYRPAWEQPVSWFDNNYASGVRGHYTATRLAIPLMLPASSGLVVFTSERAGHPDLTSHLRATAASAMAKNLATQLAGTGITAICLAPGWTRTDGVLKGMTKATGGTGPRWRTFMAESESDAYPGRCVAALAAAPDRRRLSGRTLRTGQVARRYGFTDTDGREVDN